MRRLISRGMMMLALGVPMASGWSQTGPVMPRSPLAASFQPSTGLPMGRTVIDGEASAPKTETTHITQCNFNAIKHFDERRAVANEYDVRQPYMVQDPAAMGDGMITDGGMPISEAEARRIARRANNDFTVANTWARLDVEKRFFMNYAFGNATKFATTVGYGDYDAGQVGLEVTPHIICDSPDFYFRWGWELMFQYASFRGSDFILRSAFSNNIVRVRGGDMYSAVIGPAWRADFEVFHIPVSPHISLGMSFDWVDINDDVTFTNIPQIRTINRFDFAGFDFGGMARLIVDIPVTQYLAGSIGTEFKWSSSDVMLRNNEERKHMTIVIGLTYRF